MIKIITSFEIGPSHTFQRKIWHLTFDLSCIDSVSSWKSPLQVWVKLLVFHCKSVRRFFSKAWGIDELIIIVLKIRRYRFVNLKQFCGIQRICRWVHIDRSKVKIAIYSAFRYDNKNFEVQIFSPHIQAFELDMLLQISIRSVCCLNDNLFHIASLGFVAIVSSA